MIVRMLQRLPGLNRLRQFLKIADKSRLRR